MKRTIVGVLLLLVAFSLFAQDVTKKPVVLEKPFRPMSPVVVGQGGAFTANGYGFDAFFTKLHSLVIGILPEELRARKLIIPEAREQLEPEREEFLRVREVIIPEARERLEKRLSLINHARRLMRHGRYGESRQYLTQALKMWDSPRLRQLFSMTYSRVGKVWPAIYHQRKAVAQSPGSRAAQRRLGSLYLKVGKRSAACRAFRAARASSLVKRHCGG